jgi:2'-5' RNA ligase
MARIRTFVAIALDDVILKRALALQEKLAATGAPVKWVDAQNIHVTLLFLGEVDDRQINDVCKVVAEACKKQPAFDLSIEKVGCFPNMRRPHVLWMGVGEGTKELVELHDALEIPLLELGCYRREERKYSPHITLGRTKSETPNEDLIALLVKQASWSGGKMTAREVLVMSSELTSKGPEYAVLSRAKLG